jgi:hypothetical protein
MLLAQLRSGGEPELARRVEEALGELDPALLELPAYEREVPDPGTRRSR